MEHKIVLMHIMDRSGHVTFAWDPADDKWVIPMIQKKLDEGYTFWILEDSPQRHVRLRRVQDMDDRRRLWIEDSHARALFQQGKLAVAATDQRTFRGVRRTRSAAEVASHSTLAHRPVQGG